MALTRRAAIVALVGVLAVFVVPLAGATVLIVEGALLLGIVIDLSLAGSVRARDGQRHTPERVAQVDGAIGGREEMERGRGGGRRQGLGQQLGRIVLGGNGRGRTQQQGAGQGGCDQGASSHGSPRIV